MLGLQAPAHKRRGRLYLRVQRLHLDGVLVDFPRHTRGGANAQRFRQVGENDVIVQLKFGRFELLLNGTPLAFVDSLRYLGVLFHKLGEFQPAANRTARIASGKQHAKTSFLSAFAFLRNVLRAACTKIPKITPLGAE